MTRGGSGHDVNEWMDGWRHHSDVMSENGRT